MVSTSAAVTVPGAFVSLAPARVLDTRVGVGAVKAMVAGHGTVHLQVGGVGGVPAAGVSAVVLNVTVTNPASGGFITVYPDGGVRPTASNLNLVRGQTIPNLVVVPVGAGGKVALYNGTGGALDLIADVVGLLPGRGRRCRGRSGRWRRLGCWTPVVGWVRWARWRPGRHGDLQVRWSWVGCRPSGVSAVVLNVTVTDAGAVGVRHGVSDGGVRPGDVEPELRGRVRRSPNLVVAQVGADGKVALYNGSRARVQLIADVVGLLPGRGRRVWGAFVSLAPARVLDTRSGRGCGGRRWWPGRHGASAGGWCWWGAGRGGLGGGVERDGDEPG